jgi:hypothetical protein
LQFTLVTSYPGTPLVPEFAEREPFGNCRNDLVLGDSLKSRTDTENHPDRGRNDCIGIPGSTAPRLPKKIVLAYAAA